MGRIKKYPEETAIVSMDIETCKAIEIDGQIYEAEILNNLNDELQSKAHKNVLVYSCQCMFVRRCDIDKFDKYVKIYGRFNDKFISKAIVGWEPDYCRAGSIEDGILWLENKANTYNINNMVVWVHNLSYEGEYMLRLIDRGQNDEFSFQRKLNITLVKKGDVLKEDLFALDSHELVRLGIDNKLTFKCSYKLTNQNLKKCGSDVGIKKGEDYDYNKFHLPTDKLSDEEELYCYNDVLIVCAKIRQLEIQNAVGFLPTSKKYKYHTDFPITSTGFVREDVRRAVRSNSKNNFWFKDSRLSYKEFIACKEAFAGGDTHGNYKYIGKTMGHCDSFDIGSSYPYAMLVEKYPVGKATHLKNMTYKSLARLIQNGYLFIVTLRLENIRPKHDHHILSRSKCYSINGNPIIDNGRIVELEGSLFLTCTSVDLVDYLAFYDVERIDVIDTIVWNSDYLPKEIRHVILTYYGLKQKLKGVSGEELNYALAKAMLNSIYGMFVQNPLNDVVTWDYDENIWKVNQLDYTNENLISDLLDKFYNNKSSFLPYQVGVFVTAYARHNLHTVIYGMGTSFQRKLIHKIVNGNHINYAYNYSECNNFIYCDTDSIKCRNRNEVMPVIEKYNSKVKEKIDKFYSDMKELGLMPFERKFFDNLGVFDWETSDHEYLHFITLGAKKYCTHTEKGISMTVSGLSKNAVRYIKDWEELEKVFQAGTVFDEDTSGRTVSYYVDNTVPEMGLGGVYIENTTYTIGLSKEFIAYLRKCEVDQKPVRTLHVTKDGVIEKDIPVKSYLTRLFPECIEQLKRYIERGDVFFIVGEMS